MNEKTNTSTYNKNVGFVTFTKLKWRMPDVFASNQAVRMTKFVYNKALKKRLESLDPTFFTEILIKEIINKIF